MMEIAVILHNVRSVYNVGSVFRTCDAAGVGKIYLVGTTPSPLDRFGKFRADFSKVALGVEKTVAWEYVKSFAAVYKRLKREGFQILAVEQDNKSMPYYKWKPFDKAQGENNRVALIFGEETRGLPRSVLNKADKILEIPMRGAIVRQAHHPKNKKNFKLPGKALRPFDKTQGRQAPTIAKALVGGQGKESLNVSVAAGIVIYSLISEK